MISEAGQRLEQYDKQIAAVVPGWRWEPVVRALMSLRGVALLTAATLVAELGDLNRFKTAGELMSYLGLVPSEHSTGEERHQGGIIKISGFFRGSTAFLGSFHRPTSPWEGAPDRVRSPHHAAAWVRMRQSTRLLRRAADSQPYQSPRRPHAHLLRITRTR